MTPAAPPVSAPPSPPKKKRGIIFRFFRFIFRALAITVTTVVLLVVAFTIWILYYFPNKLAADNASRLAARYGVDLSIRTLDVKPLHEATVEGLSLDVATNRHAGMPPLLTVGRVHVVWNLDDAWHKHAAHIESLEVTDPAVTLIQKGNVWNWQRAIDEVLAQLPQTPVASPTPIPKAVPIEQQIHDNADTLGNALSSIPIQADLDRLVVRGASVELKTDAGTLAKVSGAGADAVLHLPLGGKPTLVVDVPRSPLKLQLAPAADLHFAATLRPGVHLSLDLPASATFRLDTSVEEGILAAGGIEFPVAAVVKGSGTADGAAGDLDMKIDALDLDHFLEATGHASVTALGTKGFSANWNAGITGENLPQNAEARLAQALSATSFHAGAKVTGSVEGKLFSTDYPTLMREVHAGRIPVSLVLKSDGVSAENPVDSPLFKLAGLTHHAVVTVAPGTVSLDATAKLSGLSIPHLLAGRPLAVEVAGNVNVPSSLDAVDVGRASADLPELGLHAEGYGRVAGLKAALAAWRVHTPVKPAAKTQPLGTPSESERAALAAVTALSAINLGGAVDLAPSGELEVAPGTTIHGKINAKGLLLRGKDPFGRLKGDLTFQDFGLKVAGTARIAKVTEAKVASRLAGEPKLLGEVAAFLALKRAEAKKAAEMAAPAPATPPPALLVEGMNAHFVIDRELILGGHPVLDDAAIAEDEAAVFDPATRGYYDRLGSLRAAADNLVIEKASAGPLRIEHLTAEVLYDGKAVHVNRANLNLFGGEVVGKLIARPTADGLHVAASADASGIDMSPLLLDHPVADPDDTRVHASTSVSFFLSKDDPIGSLADMRMKMDMTCAGSKVIDTVLAWMDPESRDPMYNWARSIDKKVGGATRPQISAGAERGMYDVTITFPSLGLSKDIKRIPLAPLLRLRFTQAMIAGFAPPGELLPLLAARGIDADGTFLIPAVARASKVE